MVDDDHAPDRRTVLRNIAAGSAAAVGIGLGSGGASADTAQRSTASAEAFAEFGDRETVDRLFEDVGRTLASELADRGYLREVENPIESVVPLHEYGRRDDDGLATVTTGSRDGTEVIDVRLRRVTDDAEVEFHLNPAIDDGYALVYPDEGDEGTAVFADGTTGSFDATLDCCPTGCTDCGDIRCTSDRCDSNCTRDGYYVYYYEEIKCCQKVDTDTCLCSYDTYDCACSDFYEGICPE